MVKVNSVNWGPAGWKFLHSVSFAYPEHPTLVDKQRYLRFFKTLAFVLPCPACRKEYSIVSRNLSMEKLANQETLSRWLVAVHNAVNKRLGKKIVSYNTVKKMYL